MFFKHAAALVLTGVLFGAAPSIAKDYANPGLLMSAKDLATMQADQDFVLIDVRAEDAYRNGHIPGAVQIDPNGVVANESPVDGALMPISQIVDKFRRLGIGAKTRVVLYDNKGGFHAARMFWVLEYIGHRNVAMLNGGLAAWIASGGELETERRQSAMVGRLDPALTARRFASADWILERRDASNVVVIDVRPKTLWAKGHIPWAKNIPWKGNLREDLTMKSQSELTRHFAKLGVTPNKSVVVHCQNGLASAHSYFALRLIGFPRVRTYHRSWAEWGASDDLPKSALTGG